MEDKKKESAGLKIVSFGVIVVLIAIIAISIYFIYTNFQTKQYEESTENETNRDIIDLTEENFQAEVQSDKQVLVYFAADWCRDCQNMEPIIEEINQTGDYAKICRVNTDEQIELREEYEIELIPTFILFEDGQEVRRKVGEIPKEVLEEIFLDY